MKDFIDQLNKVIYPKVQKELGIENPMATPRLHKIVVNVGIGSRLKNTKDYSDIVDNVASITGQRPVVTMAKKAISNFKLREGTPSGVVATLRRKKMYDFFNRMVNVAFPRIRDFQGFSDKAFDGQGNYSIGIRDCSIFPEMNPDDLSHVHGVSISIITTAKDNESAKALLKALNFPFRKPIKKEKQDEEAASPEEAPQK
ncbi:MAG: 50S ribosomal protein L5 [Candidatus Gracilibacteria bacterium]|nr:50S ribosomal protein L5 [bacterium]MDZ4217056.1 50S ribosomal protein L5 [Candidatus Gracilibacteria bacterium]